MKVERSTKGDKKFMSRSPSGRKIHYGASGYGDFDLWRRARGLKFALKKRNRYVTSHKAILMKNGTPAWKNPETAEFYASRMLWDFPKNTPMFKKVVEIRNKQLSRDERNFINKWKNQ